MAAGNASQTTPVQIKHGFALCCFTQIMSSILISVNGLLYGVH